MYYLSIVNEWKYNMYKADYKDKHDLGVYIPSLKRKSAWSMNVYHWPKWLINEIEWFQLKVILEHAAFNARDNNMHFNNYSTYSVCFS